MGEPGSPAPPPAGPAPLAGPARPSRGGGGVGSIYLGAFSPCSFSNSQLTGRQLGMGAVIRFAVLVFLMAVVPLAAARNCSRGSGVCFEDAFHVHQQRVQKELLRQLGLEEPPTVVPLTQQQRAVLQRAIEDQHHINNRPKEIVYVWGTQVANISESTLFFPISESTARKTIARAKLHVLVQPVDMVISPMDTVEVVVRQRRIDGQLGKVVAAKHISVPAREMYIQFSLSNAQIENWWTDHRVNGVSAYAVYDGKNLALNGQNDLDMYIELEGAEEHKRRKRSNAQCTVDMKEPGCCLYDLQINFHEIGWNWVHAPIMFNAYMCKGDCSRNEHMIKHGHSKAINEVTREGVTARHSTGCCHPSEYEDLHIIYNAGKAGQEITNKIVSGMIARKCSCT